MNDIDQGAVLDKDQPLKDDIRLLGRILGDTLREQEGEDTFQLIERIRQTAIRFRREGDPQARARAGDDTGAAQSCGHRVRGQSVHVFFPAFQHRRRSASQPSSVARIRSPARRPSQGSIELALDTRGAGRRDATAISRDFSRTR